MIDVASISGIHEFEVRQEKFVDGKWERANFEVEGGENETESLRTRTVYEINGRVFLVENKNTVEVRCEKGLARRLRDDYESVMESRYFGRGGIEIVNSGQLAENEIEDLVRLSFNLTKEKENE